jgi:hypothetical protein
LPFEELRARIADALRSGRLFGARASRPMRVQREQQVEPLGPSTIVEEPETEKTFIAIELVDQDGVALAGRRFRILLPNNVMQEGTTGPDGKARVKGIDRGQCEITFPGLYDDDFDWKPALSGQRSTREKGPVVTTNDSGDAAPENAS